MKFMTLSLLIVGLLLLFNFGGIETPVTGLTKNIIADVNDPEADNPISELRDKPLITIGGVKLGLWAALLVAATTITAVGVRAGLLGSTPQISFYLAPLVVAFAGIIFIDLASLFGELWTISSAWLRIVYSLIFIPLGVGYIIATKSFIEGTDY